MERGEDGFASVEHVSSLTGHSKTVNCVRFSPTGAEVAAEVFCRSCPPPPAAADPAPGPCAGQYLATSGDGGELLLWQPSDGTAAARGNLEQEESEATWKRVAGLR